jgi:hypothetical protein
MDLRWHLCRGRWRRRAADADDTRFVQKSRGAVRPIGFCAAVICIAGCTPLGLRPGIERADDIGLQSKAADVQQLPPLLPLPADPFSQQARDQIYRDAFVEQWMARSDLLCREYKDKIILVSRSSRFATDATTTVLSGLATIFTAVGTIHPLTGAATIVSGVGAAAQTDTFAQQSGEIIASAIQTARENQANQIEGNLSLSPDQYSIYRAQRDVIDYHNMCSLETALAQVRSSLKATSPNQGNLPPATQGGLTPVTPQTPPPPAPPPVTAPPPQPAPPPPPPLHRRTASPQACEAMVGDLRKHGLTTCGDFAVIRDLLGAANAKTPSDPLFQDAVRAKKRSEAPPEIPDSAVVTRRLRMVLANPASPAGTVLPGGGPAPPPANAPTPPPPNAPAGPPG